MRRFFSSLALTAALIVGGSSALITPAPALAAVEFCGADAPPDLHHGEHYVCQLFLDEKATVVGSKLDTFVTVFIKDPEGNFAAFFTEFCDAQKPKFDVRIGKGADHTVTVKCTDKVRKNRKR